MTTAVQVIEARRLRDTARAIVRTDISTVRLELAERPLVQRVRDQVAKTTNQVAEDGVALARDNPAIVGLTVAAILGWLFRKPLSTLIQTALKRWRH